MKVGILTMYYGNISHGGLLQALSLCESIKSLGYDAEQIKYDYNARFATRSLIKKTKRLIRSIPYKMLCIANKDHSRGKYYSYMDEVPHSVYYSPETISESGNKYDVFVVGSDQVWNMDYCDENFFFPFAKNKKRISYAASVGKNHLNKEESAQLIENIKAFQHISVRELQLKEYLNRVSDIQCDCVSDPVFLNDSTFWRSHAVYPTGTGKYTLIYILSNDNEEKKKAYELAKRIGYPAVIVPNVNLNMKSSSFKYSDKQVFNVGPREFLGLIDKAEYILTDSFHCTAFSIIFNKNFYAFDRPNKGFSMNSRITSLLNKVELTQRFIDLNGFGTLELDNIDYSKSNVELDEYARESKSWLLNALKE